MCSLCLWAGAQSPRACESRRRSCPLAVVKRRWAKNDDPAHLACLLPVSTGWLKIPVQGTHGTFADGAERASIARQLLHREDNQPCALTARSNGPWLALEGVTDGTQQTVHRTTMPSLGPYGAETLCAPWIAWTCAGRTHWSVLTEGGWVLVARRARCLFCADTALDSGRCDTPHSVLVAGLLSFVESFADAAEDLLAGTYASFYFCFDYCKLSLQPHVSCSIWLP
jgi:hypothetical protein